MNPQEQLNATLTGRYAIEREIGAGGMATVYLARDLRHNRHVALKVLKPELAAVLGVERFLSEIQVTANLQHPNLLPLFDSGEANGLLFYVMPFVEGESLRARLDREKQLPIDEALRIAVAIAGALDYAHQHGVIHRDLKPENILLQHGQPVLADFGIALAVANAGGTRVTQTGLSLGTPKYMSPEQATGDRVIDGRTDIYSLAAVLYECLTSDPPHSGNTAQAIIARVLSEKPRSVRSSRDRVPEFVEMAIERGLAKLAADRFATARDFAQALSGPPVGGYTHGYTSGYASGVAAPEQDVRVTFAMSRTRIRSLALWTLGAAVIAAGAWGWVRPEAVPPALHVRFTLDASDSVRPREDIGGQNVALSPDGTMLVYVGGPGNAQLLMRRLDEREARPIPGTDGAFQPRFSPDGRWLAYITGTTLKRMPVGGGPAVAIADSVGRYSWGDGDVIVVDHSGTGTLRLASDARDLAPLDTTLKETSHTWPQVLPGGKAMLFTIQRGAPATGRLAAMRFSDRRIIRFDVAGLNPRYLSSGHVLLGRLDGTVVAVPFDARALTVTGPAATALDFVVVKGGGATELAVTPSGTLAYVEGIVRQQLVMVDRTGLAQALLPVVKRLANPRLSPSGDRAAITIADDGNTTTATDIWIVHIASRQLARLTNDGRSSQPEWSPDGKRIVWLFKADSGNEVRTQAWDGSGKPETIPTAGHSFNSAVPSPTGGSFVSSQFSKPPSLHEDIWVTPMTGGSGSRTLLRADADEYMPRLSSDGKWLAYIMGDGTTYQVFVTPADGSGSPRQISTAGASEPMWSPTGLSLFYREAGRLVESRITSSSPFQVTTDTLFTDSFRQDLTYPAFDVARDGQHFLMLRTGDQRERVVVTIGWFDELRARMGQVAKK